MSDLLQDFRFALRGLAKRPGYAVAALLTLVLGIGANTAIFSMADALLLRPLPLGDHGERVVTLHSTHPSQPQDWEDSPLSYADLQDLAAGAPSLEGIGGYFGRSFTLFEDGEAERLRGGSLTPNLFPLLGLRPALGRSFAPEDGAEPGFEQVLILSHRLWQRRFGGDPGIVGRGVRINGRALTVVGIMPEGIRFPERDELWVPYTPREARRDQRVMHLSFGVLRPGAELSQAQREVSAVASRLASEYPESNRGWGVRVLEFREFAVDAGIRAVVAALLVAVGCVLLIGCANLANLALARGLSRQRELAVRAALGASRRRLVGELLAESVLLSAAGALLGAVVGSWMLDVLVGSWPEELPYWIRFETDWRMLAFTAGLGLATALAVGLLPALRATRGDPADDLKEGSRGSQGASHHRLQGALVVGQVALCLALLVGANLMIRSALRLGAAPSGFDEARLLTLGVFISGDAYDRVETRAALVAGMEDAVRALPGVEQAAFTSSIPTDDGGLPIRIVTDGQAVPAGEEPGAISIVASPALFDALGVRLVAGRGFDAAEHANPETDVALVNRRLAQRFWPEGDAVGRRIGIVGSAGAVSWRRIVGIAPDLQYEEFGEETAQSRLNVFVPYATRPYRGLALFVRTHTDPRAQVEAVRQALRAQEPTVATSQVRTMDEVRVATTWEQRLFGHMMGAFAALALLLACLGIYGVLSYAVVQRRQEIGIRMALGARALDVLRLVLRRGATLGLLGLAAGLVLALALVRGLGSILYGVEPFDPVAFAGMGALLFAIVLVASLLPARRAASIDPMAVLRGE